jgi:hypothetical protein
MNIDALLQQLAQLSPRMYSYAALAALLGPFTLRFFGFKVLSRVIRPLALVVLIGGVYAKRQRTDTLMESP